MKIFLQVTGAIFLLFGSLIALLSRTEFSDKNKRRLRIILALKSKPEFLFWIQVGLGLGIAVCGIGVYLIPDSTKIEGTVGPRDSLASIATYKAFEKEIMHLSSDAAGQSRDYFRAAERDLNSHNYAEAVTGFRKSVELVPTASGYLNLGVTLFYTGHLRASDDALSAGVNILNHNDSIADLKPAFLVAQGIVINAKGNSDEAIGYFNRALKDVGNKLTPTQGAAEAGIGTASFELSRIDESITHLNTAHDIYIQLNDKRSQAQILADLAAVMFEKGDITTALDYSKEALELAGTDMFVTAKILDSQGRLYHSSGKLAESGTKYDDALQLSRKSGSRFLDAIILNDIADLLNDQGEWKASLKISQQALDIFSDRDEEGNPNKESDPNDVAVIKITRGNTFAYLNEVENALLLFEQAESLAQETGNVLEEAEALGNKAEMYRLKKDYDSSFQSGLKSLELYSQIGRVRNQANAFLELGNTCRVIKDMKCAEAVYKVGASIASGIKDARLEGLARGNLGGLFIDERNFPVAIEHLQAAIPLLRDQAKYPQGYADVLVNLAVAYENTKRFSDALKTLDDARVVYEKLGGNDPKLPLINKEIQELHKLGAHR